MTPLPPNAEVPRHRGRSAFAAVRTRLALARASASVPAALQIALASLVSYVIAHEVLGHPNPVIAVTMVVSSLGFVRDARPVRVLESAVAMTLGIALSELLVLGVGQGVWQLGLVLLVTLLLSRLLASSSSFAIAAGVQAAMVMVLPVPDGGPFLRSIDGLVGGAVALAATALIPRDPRRAARRDGERLFAEFQDVLAALVPPLAVGGPAEHALRRARASSELAERWRESLDSAVAIARVSPFLRRYLDELIAQREVCQAMDLAVRNLRVYARKVHYLASEGGTRPAVADLVARTAAAVALLEEGQRDIAQRPVARQSVIQLARYADPQAILPGEPLREQELVLLLRPLFVDLLVATGMDRAAAVEVLPVLPG